jgi:bifunctional N-acetylglucosamine-1-phosphate-uridyltransferase/glucosamine-1-phosphate-acetyltransferase GlmU-like protein
MPQFTLTQNNNKGKKYLTNVIELIKCRDENWTQYLSEKTIKVGI